MASSDANHPLLSRLAFDCVEAARQSKPSSLEESRRLINDLLDRKGFAAPQDFVNALAAEALKQHRWSKTATRLRGRLSGLFSSGGAAEATNWMQPPRHATYHSTPGREVIAGIRVIDKVALPVFERIAAESAATVETTGPLIHVEHWNVQCWLALDPLAGEGTVSANIGKEVVGYLTHDDTRDLVNQGVRHLPEFGRSVAVAGAMIPRDDAHFDLVLSFPT